MPSVWLFGVLLQIVCPLSGLRGWVMKDTPLIAWKRSRVWKFELSHYYDRIIAFFVQAFFLAIYRLRLSHAFRWVEIYMIPITLYLTIFVKGSHRGGAGLARKSRIIFTVLIEWRSSMSFRCTVRHRIFLIFYICWFC